MADRYTLRLPALQVSQGARSIFCFAVDGKRLHEFTAVSRIHRNDDEELQGYQRPEALSHIRAIRRYLESDSAILPNAIVLAFDTSVRFEPTAQTRSRGSSAAEQYSVPGELVIEVDESLPEDQKPAWLVDGQQRSAAIRDADLASFPIAAVGFIADGQAEQRSQFILVNSTKPLPKGLVNELLPDTSGHLPPAYARRQLPARLMTRLNTDGNGAFYGRVSSPTAPLGYIKDNSLLKVLEHSLYEGALYQYRNSDGSGDVERMLAHFQAYWCLVWKTFRDAWRLPPKESRLTHGVGLQAMGFVMDRLTAETPVEEVDWDRVREVLESLHDHVAWTSGTWKFTDGERPWNSLQNTPTDLRLLSNFLKPLTQG
ncbi:DGQHR domain-containing protein DpdB [Streptomyces polygonati]|uniref:DGQHR domain-containing protein DpdB n=1 Tax=Streptomyces polygonati TaxID=1617087 RepID=A0ABV8HUF9_9ACTN